ncbi:MAG TPA: hypothetical protein P5528_03395 [Steroidobacteraceae bacterium]|nr:hypothetical protein [Steroidobacteraceae bacterium]HRX88468.1 hypothetical protein [Steroidobacteraceae bacterium]
MNVVRTDRDTGWRQISLQCCRLAALCVAAVLAACSGGGDGSIQSIGAGQAPDPATVDFPIFYVQRSIPPEQDDLRQMRDFVPGAALFKRDRASPSAAETNITQRVTNDLPYDVKDVDVSADGLRVAFAMRGPLDDDMDEDEGPTWNIWEYEIATDTLRRVIPSDIIAEEGQDVSPHYLPDGRLVFSSTRQRQAKAILLDEGKPQFEAQNEARDEPAFVLHVMNADGSNIKQISFNQSHDLDATVLSNGRVLWTRWDRGPGRDGMHLYSANPDGTELELYYGANSHATGTNGTTVQFVRAREMLDGNLLVLTRPYTDSEFGGDLTIIDAITYVENNQATLNNAGMAGPAQKRATLNDVRTIEGPSPGGRFNGAFPLWDGTNRILVSWSQCRLLDTADPTRIVPCTSDRLANPAVQTAPPLYSIWIFDPKQNTLLPIMQPTEDVMYGEIVAAQPRREPRVILDKLAPLDLDPDFVTEAVGVIDIKSVYDIAGVDTARRVDGTPNGTPTTIAALADPRQATAIQRPARFLRLEKPVSIPDDDVRDIDGSAFGPTGVMREILGYIPIEPDGSVRMKVPANVAFAISILDSNGQRISQLHREWLQVRPGEVVTCNGCHNRTAQNPQSHGRRNLFPAAYPGAAQTAAFPNTLATIVPNAGETMAQARARVSCADPTARCASITPKVDVEFEDVWTDPVASGRAADTALAWRYNDLTTPSPTSADCSTRWTATCRIVINYEQHVHPLWSTPRLSLAADGVTVLSDHTCTNCHNTRDAAGVAMVPAGQLDLSDGPSDDVALQFRSYRELLFTDNAQEVNMGGLQDVVVPGPPDAAGNPTLVGVPVSPTMRALNARGSTRFFSRFAVGGSHDGYMSPAELRLLSEWLDIGAQYYNDPFQAPEN